MHRSRLRTRLRAEGSGGIAPYVPVNGAIAAKRSVDFGKMNGVLSAQVRRIQTDKITNFTGNGTTPVSGTLIFRHQIDLSTLRADLSLTSAANTAKGPNVSVLFANGSASSNTYYIAYYGGSYVTAAWRNRYVVKFNNGVGTYSTAISQKWLTDEPHTIVASLDVAGGNLYIDLVKQDGTILSGLNTGGGDATPATGISGWKGTAAPSNNTWIGAIHSLVSPTQQAERGCISDYAYVRRVLTPTETANIGKGQTPGAVIIDGTLSRWFQMNGPSGTGLVKTGGVDSVADLIPTYVGSDLVLQAGPSLAPANNGTKSLRLGYLPQGYVAGVNPDAPNAGASLPVPTITNGGGGATHIRARLVRWSDATTTGTGYTAWVRLTSTPLADGASLSGALLPVPSLTPWCHIEVQREDDTTVSVVSERCGVGAKVIIDGQSRERIAAQDFEPSDATVLDGTVPGGTSNVSFALVFNENPITATPTSTGILVDSNVAYGIIRERQDAGEGFKLLAKQWTAAYPDYLLCIGSTAYPGLGRNVLYNDLTVATTATWNYWGDNSSSNSGFVTALLNQMCKGPSRDITGFIQKPGSADLTITSRYVGRHNSLWVGADRTNAGDGESGAPARYWSASATNLTYGLKRIAMTHAPRSLSGQTGTKADRNSGAGYASTPSMTQWHTAVWTLIADSVIPSSIKQYGGNSLDQALALADLLHFPTNLLSGMARSFVRNIPDIASWLGLTTVNNNVTPPATGTINGGRTTVTMTLTPQNGGTFQAVDGGATIGGWEVTTDAAANWDYVDPATVSISGNTLTITGSWAGVSNANLSFRYITGSYPYFLYPGADFQTFSSQSTAMDADNAALPRFIIETRSDLVATTEKGVLMQPSTTNVVIS